VEGEQSAGEQPDPLLVLGRIEFEHDQITVCLLVLTCEAAAQSGQDGAAVCGCVFIRPVEVTVHPIQVTNELLARAFGARRGTGRGVSHAAASGSDEVNRSTPPRKIFTRTLRARW
jgi:hypothetical protein